MRIIKCDRCKKEIKQLDGTEKTSNGEFRVRCYKKFEFDLCQNCTQELLKFFDGAQVLEKVGEDNGNYQRKDFVK